MTGPSVTAEFTGDAVVVVKFHPGTTRIHLNTVQAGDLRDALTELLQGSDT